MKLGIWTSFYRELGPAEVLKRLAGLGWRDLELGAEHVLSLTEGPE